MQVFIDTYVLVSAFTTRGLSADVMRLVLAGHELRTSEVVIDELRRVLVEKFELPTEQVDQIEELLRSYHVEPEVESDPPIDVRDPDDALVLASAIAAEADVLITGDKDLLDEADRVEAINIRTPRSFWRTNRSRGGNTPRS